MIACLEPLRIEHVMCSTSQSDNACTQVWMRVCKSDSIVAPCAESPHHDLFRINTWLLLDPVEQRVPLSIWTCRV